MFSLEWSNLLDAGISVLTRIRALRRKKHEIQRPFYLTTPVRLISIGQEFCPTPGSAEKRVVTGMLRYTVWESGDSCVGRGF